MADAAAPRRGRPPRSAEERAARRTALLERVIAAIRQAGPEISLDEIAASAGVSKPVLYGEFGSRVGLADALSLQRADRVQASVLQRLSEADQPGVDTIVDAIVDATIALVEEENEVYRFILRTMQADSRGLLDNPLVRVLHERIAPFVNAVAPQVTPAELGILTDGVYGFMFAAIESWHHDKRLSREAMVAMTAGVIAEGLRTIAARPVDP
jgi:AcrR family transcriptional regulator